ncbi:hypothetical protein [Primorskyibacter sp. S87]|uniref:hypothetical protein n=1 Tax=Primorskyibacter sp. S87 TaxID=3415126 RepID=UPI003C7E7A8E
MRLLLICLIATCFGLAANADVTARSGGPGEKEMISRGGSGGVDGVSFFRPVLSGVLYRSGFKGGDKGRTGLSQNQRKAFCDQGFSAGFYADFGKNTDYGQTSCGAGGFDYEAARSSRPANVMKAIHNVIENPGKGPVLVHCMWGVHSSGALSAMALVQFCGWSEDRAKSYWNKARNNAPCSGGCDKWIDAKFSNFKVDPALNISDAQKAAICPK